MTSCENDLYNSSNLGSVLSVIFAKSISYVSFLSASPWCSLVPHVLSVGYAVTTQTRSIVSQLMCQVVSSVSLTNRRLVDSLLVNFFTVYLVCSESLSLTVTKLVSLTVDQSGQSLNSEHLIISNSSTVVSRSIRRSNNQPCNNSLYLFYKKQVSLLASSPIWAS